MHDQEELRAECGSLHGCGSSRRLPYIPRTSWGGLLVRHPRSSRRYRYLAATVAVSRRTAGPRSISASRIAEKVVGLKSAYRGVMPITAAIKEIPHAVVSSRTRPAFVPGFL
jgi:hypothetical protein